MVFALVHSSSRHVFASKCLQFAISGVKWQNGDNGQRSNRNESSKGCISIISDIERYIRFILSSKTDTCGLTSPFLGDVKRFTASTLQRAHKNMEISIFYIIPYCSRCHFGICAQVCRAKRLPPFSPFRTIPFHSILCNAHFSNGVCCLVIGPANRGL